MGVCVCKQVDRQSNRELGFIQTNTTFVSCYAKLASRFLIIISLIFSYEFPVIRCLSSLFMFYRNEPLLSGDVIKDGLFARVTDLFVSTESNGSGPVSAKERGGQLVLEAF